ncbi:MAG: hypothetical protein IH571_00245 [Acholeplasmataceae bacterium]|nr:hypothetical protein [Acholeplasmataceae bacterium]
MLIKKNRNVAFIALFVSSFFVLLSMVGSHFELYYLIIHWIHYPFYLLSVLAISVSLICLIRYQTVKDFLLFLFSFVPLAIFIAYILFIISQFPIF